MEKKIHIPQKHAAHINWNSIIQPALGVWQHVRVTQDQYGDVTVDMTDESLHDADTHGKAAKWDYFQAFVKAHGANSITGLTLQRDLMRTALRLLLKRFTTLVQSGDCGNRDVESEASVISARHALNSVKEPTQEVE